MKISEMTDGGVIQDTDEVPVVRSGANYRTTVPAGVPATRTVNGYPLSSDVSLVASDLALGNVDNTSDANKPVSTATQTALDLKVNTSRTVNGHALTADVTVTKGDVGLGSVENTALSTWAGSANITTLGTIGTGVWNATTIADGKIASALTGKTYNGLTLTALSTGFSVAGGTTSKTLTVSNSLTFAGTDGSTLNIGAGGTLGSAAFTASGAYEVPMTFGTGLTRTVNTVTVNTSQNIATLSNLTTDGLVTTSGGAGTLGVTVPGTGVLTALAVNVGSAGAFVTFNGALGTPSSGVVTNLTGTAAINITGTVKGNTFTTGSSTYTGSAGQTYTFPTTSATIARIDAANTFVGASTGTSWTMTTIVLAGGITASGSGSNDFSASSGTFKTSTGANQLSGAVTVTDATTPSITLTAGSTNTGFLLINGKTSGGLKFLPADASGQTVTVALAAQTVGTATLSIPDMANVSDTFAFLTKSQTFGGTNSYSAVTAIDVLSTSTSGIRIENQADVTTNYERMELLYTSNVGTIQTTKGGTGTTRNLNLSAGGNGGILMRTSGSSGGYVQLIAASTSVAGVTAYNFSGYTSTATSGSNIGISFTPTYNQASGTAANTDVLINRTQTAVGSGTQTFLDMQVGGTSRARFGTTGQILSSTMTNGLQVHNQTDETTNYERMDFRWNSNIAEVGPVFGGTGNANRVFWIGVGSTAGGSVSSGRAIRIINNIGTTPVFTFNTSTSLASLTLCNITGTNTATSGTTIGLLINHTYNQASGTAVNTDLLINRTETALGSGAQSFEDFQIAGTSKWRVTNVGNLISAGSLATAAPAGASANAWKLGSLVAGAVVVDTTRSLYVDVAGTVYKVLVST